MKIVLASQSPGGGSCWGRWDWNLPHSRRRSTSAFHGQDARDLVETSPGRRPAGWPGSRPQTPWSSGRTQWWSWTGPSWASPGTGKAGPCWPPCPGRTTRCSPGSPSARGTGSSPRPRGPRSPSAPSPARRSRQYVLHRGAHWTRPGPMASRAWGPAGGGGHPGDYHNVIGLPICRLGRMLLDFGVDCCLARPLISPPSMPARPEDRRETLDTMHMDQNHRRGSVSEPHRRRCGPGPLGDRGVLDGMGRDGVTAFSTWRPTVTGWAEQRRPIFPRVEALRPRRPPLEEVAQLQAAALGRGAGPAGECPPPGLLDWPETGQDLTLTPPGSSPAPPDNWQRRSPWTREAQEPPARPVRVWTLPGPGGAG